MSQRRGHGREGPPAGGLTHSTPLGRHTGCDISLFKWPNVLDIWSTYLTKFIARYGDASWSGHATSLSRRWMAALPNMPRAGGQMVLGWGHIQAQPLTSGPPPPLRSAQRCTCCTRSWKKSGAWRDTPWQCMSVPPGLWATRSSP